MKQISHLIVDVQFYENDDTYFSSCERIRIPVPENGLQNLRQIFHCSSLWHKDQLSANGNTIFKYDFVQEVFNKFVEGDQQADTAESILESNKEHYKSLKIKLIAQPQYWFADGSSMFECCGESCEQEFDFTELANGNPKFEQWKQSVANSLQSLLSQGEFCIPGYVPESLEAQCALVVNKRIREKGNSNAKLQPGQLTIPPSLVMEYFPMYKKAFISLERKSLKRKLDTVTDEQVENKLQKKHDYSKKSSDQSSITGSRVDLTQNPVPALESSDCKEKSSQ